MEAQSLIDVSGTTSTVLADGPEHVQLQLRGNEFKDSPVQRNGALYGRRFGGRAQGHAAGRRERRRQGDPAFRQRASLGGWYRQASSEGDVVVAKGATVDFSGGQVRYKGGYLNTSKLYAKNGTVVDIGNANPNQTYTAVLGTYQENHPAWGISKTYSLPGIDTGSGYTPGYVQGMDAGTFSVQAPGVLLDGQLQGAAVVGALQRQAPGPLASATQVWDRPYNQMPYGGQLIIGDPAQASQSPRTSVRRA